MAAHDQAVASRRDENLMSRQYDCIFEYLNKQRSVSQITRCAGRWKLTKNHKMKTKKKYEKIIEYPLKTCKEF